MSKFIDFAALKEEVTIEQVVDMLQLRLKQNNNQLRGSCPACEENGRSLVVTPAKGVFYCFRDKKGGDLIALASHVLGVSAKDAAIAIAEQYGIGNSTGNGTVPSEPQERGSEGGEKTLEPLNYLDAGHDAVLAVGFDPEDAERIGIGYAPKGLMRGTVAVPIRLPDGQLVGYLGVTEAKLPPKWQFTRGAGAPNVVSFPKKTA
ncbi:MAG: CHC2 zinc finger domain-containing protein [Bauldia litoralis]|uniref:CHC2 zinc finger domain-containing protein n=1 Tax=Bauldia litoralis TaxID=665467 RepID=UPI00329940B0